MPRLGFFYQLPLSLCLALQTRGEKADGEIEGRRCNPASQPAHGDGDGVGERILMLSNSRLDLVDTADRMLFQTVTPLHNRCQPAPITPTSSGTQVPGPNASRLKTSKGASPANSVQDTTTGAVHVEGWQ